MKKFLRLCKIAKARFNWPVRVYSVEAGWLVYVYDKRIYRARLKELIVHELSLS